jgi:serine phosphatase RsbU (regulator of sigma subunit)
MFTLRDFIHLPDLEGVLTQLAETKSGMIVIAGMDRRVGTTHSPGDLILPGGCLTICEVLTQFILEKKPQEKALIVTEDRTFLKPAHAQKKRFEQLLVSGTNPYSRSIQNAAERHPGLLVIDRLNEESIEPAFEAASTGNLVLSAFDTFLQGQAVSRQLEPLIDRQYLLDSLAWVVSVQRLSTLCLRCKQPDDTALQKLESLKERNPSLTSLAKTILKQEQTDQTTASFYRPVGCRNCVSGRAGEVYAFDVFQGGRDRQREVKRPSRLAFDEYLLRLCAEGRLAIDDLIHFQDRLQIHIHRLLKTGEQGFHDVSDSLKSRLAELEAANRVLIQRTEVLFSLQEMSHALITSGNLARLAARICTRLENLCGADHAVLYYFPFDGGLPSRQAEILAVMGWPDHLAGARLDASLLEKPGTGAKPGRFSGLPPGVTPGKTKPENLRAGLRLPLYVEDRLTGVLIVQSTRKGSFNPSESALLQAFADQAALAIQRAGLVSALRRKIDELEAAQADLVKKERLERELELARQVQQSVLPRSFPIAKGYDFAARNEPARQVGGDFYDIFEPAPGLIGLVIGDVSDKGMASALYMALTRSLLLAEARRETSPRKVLKSVNHLLLEMGEPARFVSVFYGIIDTAASELTYARAGHDYPFLLREGEAQVLTAEGKVLCVFEGDEFSLEERRISLKSGDRLVLYTDGLTDAPDPEGRFFEIERLLPLFQECASLSPFDMCEKVFLTLEKHRSDAEQFDDMTLLVVQT